MSSKILVIEDEAPLRAQVVEMLELEGYDVSEAENGGIALGLLQNLHPDIIICDIAMPDFDGYQILEHVRDNERLAMIPFIFVTARSDRSFVRHGMDLGADDYITKPFSRGELLKSIESRLARFRQSIGVPSDDVLIDAKRKLTSLVAHELRTPLVSMTMIHELISQKLDDLSGDEMRDLLKMMQTGNQRMQHLVEQMVVFTQLNTNVIDENTVEEHGRSLDMQLVIKNAITQGRSFAYRNQDGTIKRLQNKPYAVVKALIKPLSFGIAELIANALVFSPENSSVIIQEHIVNDTWLHLNIVDSGAGLTTTRLKKASMPFEQIDREKQEQQGMGMGLPLAIKIIEIHGGDISFQSTASGGTQVTVKLPLSS
ncbi:MAG: hybrid sensor histidine kinase/response regulator [Phototrophicaceae bacterium]